jgi:PPOX class probable FMN-dependent enzyme
MKIDTVAALRGLYAAPTERALKKEIRALDAHCKRFLTLSPFVVLATADKDGNADASPRGGAPGFVKALDEKTLLIPDSPGNNRLDTLENIVASGRVGLLFMIPGVDETLRVNGRASLSNDPAEIALCRNERREPKLVIRVAVEGAYLHCAKAFLRSQLWKAASQVDRSVLPTIGQMIADQTGIQVPPETREEMEKRYAPDL